MPKTTTHILGSKPPGPSTPRRVAVASTAKAAGHAVFTVPNQAMIPALRIRDVVRFDRDAYKRAPVERGNVVVYLSEKHDGVLLPSRAVGLPGETIELRRGVLMIDGVKVEEPYLDADASQKPYSKNHGPIAIPESCVFLLGDFRDLSEDSRIIGPLAAELILGRLVL
jgi:signal peptidase I